MSKSRRDGRRGHRVNSFRAPRGKRLEIYRNARLERERCKEFQAEIIEAQRSELYDQMMERERLLNEPKPEDFGWLLGDEMSFEDSTWFHDADMYQYDDYPHGRYDFGYDMDVQIESVRRQSLLDELKTEIHAAVGRVVRRRGTVYARQSATVLATAFDVPVALIHAAIDVLPYQFDN